MKIPGNHVSRRQTRILTAAWWTPPSAWGAASLLIRTQVSDIDLFLATALDTVNAVIDKVWSYYLSVTLRF